MCEEAITLEKVAIVRFDVADRRALISINLSPLKRGTGMAESCLSGAIDFFAASYPLVRTINAEIKRVNVASKRSFERVGFVFVRVEAHVLYYDYSV